jgi:hypothetical protein
MWFGVLELLSSFFVTFITGVSLLFRIYLSIIHF